MDEGCVSTTSVYDSIVDHPYLILCQPYLDNGNFWIKSSGMGITNDWVAMAIPKVYL